MFFDLSSVIFMCEACPPMKLFGGKTKTLNVQRVITNVYDRVPLYSKLPLPDQAAESDSHFLPFRPRSGVLYQLALE